RRPGARRTQVADRVVPETLHREHRIASRPRAPAYDARDPPDLCRDEVAQHPITACMSQTTTCTSCVRSDREASAQTGDRCTNSTNTPALPEKLWLGLARLEHRSSAARQKAL